MLAEALGPVRRRHEAGMRQHEHRDQLAVEPERLGQGVLDLPLDRGRGAGELRMTLPLAMYVDTFEWPSSSRSSRSGAIGTLFLPPTLMPRSRMRYLVTVRGSQTLDHRTYKIGRR